MLYTVPLNHQDRKVLKALFNIPRRKTLKSHLKWMGSQCKLACIGVILVNFLVIVRSQDASFCTNCRLTRHGKTREQYITIIEVRRNAFIKISLSQADRKGRIEMILWRWKKNTKSKIKHSSSNEN